MEKKRIAVWGSTGSIGKNTIRVARNLRDRLEITAVAARSNVSMLAEQAREFNCRYAVIFDPAHFEDLKQALPPGCKALCGLDGLLETAAAPEVDTVLCAMVGTASLPPVIEAIRQKKTIALANKEVLVTAGKLVMRLARENGVRILPVDSEHSAVFQCLEGRSPESVETLILTASGGPFRKTPADALAKMTWADAQKHPTWSMGPKVTMDSATLMNKALEMLEAHFLFQVPGERIKVLVHPQSIIHSMVEFTDGSVLALLSQPDMRFPIQYSLTWPERPSTGLPKLDLAQIATLTFEEPDRNRFPSLDLAYRAIREGGTLPAVLNAANEIAVERFHRGEISLPEIWKITEKTMDAHKKLEEYDLCAILKVGQWAKAFASTL